MQCPFCQTENREDREKCYACDKDISMLRLIVNKARHHYNIGLEHAERGRLVEAIDELNNAIDLDRRFVTAHVVLGTLYAKRGEFDKARQSWNTALELNPDFAKAHTYIERVQTVQTAMPTIRRWRWAAVISALLALALGTSLILSQRETDEVRAIRVAREHYDAQRDSKALRELERIRKMRRPDKTVAIAAAALQDAIRERMNEQVRRIQDLKFAQLYPQALQEIAALEARSPDAVTSGALGALRDDINYYYTSQINELYELFRNEEVPFEELRAQVEEFMQAYPDLPEKDILRQQLASAMSIETQRRVKAIEDEFTETRNLAAAITALEDLPEEFRQAQEYEVGRRELIERMLTWVFDERLRELLDTREFEEAQGLLDEVLEVGGAIDDVVKVEGLVELALETLHEEEKSVHLKTTEKFVRTGSVDEAIEALIHASARDDLTTAERHLVESLHQEVDRREVQQALDQLRERERAFVRLDITEEEATRTLHLFDEAPMEAFQQMSSTDRADMLAYSAAAALRLNDREIAEAMLEELRKEQPAHRFVLALDRLLKRRKR